MSAGPPHSSTCALRVTNCREVGASPTGSAVSTFDQAWRISHQTEHTTHNCPNRKAAAAQSLNREVRKISSHSSPKYRFTSSLLVGEKIQPPFLTETCC